MSKITTTNSNESYLSEGKFEHAYRIAKMMAQSQLVPKAFQGKPQDILLAMEFGTSLGLAPLPAVQNIAVINGRPSLYGDLMLAVCQGRPDFEDIIEEPILDSNKKIAGYTCTVKRKGRTPVVYSFTVDDAKQAGLWGKPGPWSQYSSRMLMMRARAFALRSAFADALGGIHCAEEVQDYPKDITPKSNNSHAKEVLTELLDKPKGNNFPDDPPTPKVEG